MSEYVLGNNISQTETVQLQQQPRWHHTFQWEFGLSNSASLPIASTNLHTKTHVYFYNETDWPGKLFPVLLDFKLENRHIYPLS